jgi:hypothetical protein
MNDSATTFPDPFDRFQELYRILADRSSPHEDLPWLGFAAYAAVLTSGTTTHIADKIRCKADLLQKHSPWYSALASPLRFAVAASLVQSDCLIRRYEAQLQVLRRLIAAEHLHPSSGTLAVLATIISLMEDGKGPSALRITRLAAFHHLVTKDAAWQIGSEHLPACLLLTYRRGTAQALVAESRRFSSALAGLGLLHGQGVGAINRFLLLGYDHDHPVLDRYQNLLNLYHHEHTSIDQPMSQVLATLAVLDHPQERVFAELYRTTAQLIALEPNLDHEPISVLAGDLTFLRLARIDVWGQPWSTASQRQEMFRLLRQQQATALILACEAMSEVPANILQESDPFLSNHESR